MEIEKLTQEEYQKLKSKFFATYANVPRPLRKEIVAVVGDEGLSWFACRIEIEKNSEESKKILTQLKEMEVL